MSLVLWCAAALAVAASASGPVYASPQEPAGLPATSLERVKKQLERPPGPPLTPSVPVQSRPTFRSGVEQRVYVLTFEEDLHKTFDLNYFQRQSAEWSAKCCGMDPVMLIKAVDKALDERRVRKTREQIARELAELEAAKLATQR